MCYECVCNAFDLIYGKYLKYIVYIYKFMSAVRISAEGEKKNTISKKVFDSKRLEKRLEPE